MRDLAVILGFVMCGLGHCLPTWPEAKSLGYSAETPAPSP